MSESVRTCFHILPVCGYDALGNSDNNSTVALHHSCNIVKETLHIKAARKCLGNVNKVGRRLAVCTENAGGRCEPARISAHYLNDGDGLDTVNTAVSDNFLQSCGNILCGRAEAGSVVGHREVVVDSLGHADNF